MIAASFPSDKYHQILLYLRFSNYCPGWARSRSKSARNPGKIACPTGVITDLPRIICIVNPGLGLKSVKKGTVSRFQKWNVGRNKERRCLSEGNRVGASALLTPGLVRSAQGGL